MKIQCSVCEAAEAKLFCCVDEAALCISCDQEIHAANKLAGKHSRISLSVSSSPMPKCDICQETRSFFFCIEDRALLCRKCNNSIHGSKPYGFSHRRLLLTGVKVGLESTQFGPLTPDLQTELISNGFKSPMNGPDRVACFSCSYGSPAESKPASQPNQCAQDGSSSNQMEGNQLVLDWLELVQSSDKF